MSRGEAGPSAMQLQPWAQPRPVPFKPLYPTSSKEVFGKHKTTQSCFGTIPTLPLLPPSYMTERSENKDTCLPTTKETGASERDRGRPVMWPRGWIHLR